MQLELRSSIDGQDARLTWRDGELGGDDEFIRRVLRFALIVDVDLATADQAEIIRLARHALAAPVVIAEIQTPT